MLIIISGKKSREKKMTENIGVLGEKETWNTT